MRCPKCGMTVEDDDRFCPNCGSHIEQNASHTNIPVIIIIVSFLFLTAASIIGLKIIGDKNSKETAKDLNVEADKAADQDAINEVYKEANKEADKEVNKKAGKEANKWSDNEADKKANEGVVFQPAVESEYVQPESNSRYLSESDVEGLGIREINYAKNEIYARHGRKFKSAELTNYFSGKAWYTAKYEPDDFDKNYSASFLNMYEKKNVEFLREKEYAMNSAGYQLDVQ